jgi:hypothetical protein
MLLVRELGAVCNQEKQTQEGGKNQVRATALCDS